MKRADQESLLRDAFEDPALAALRAKSLGDMLNVASLRSRRRAIVSGEAASIVAMTALFVITQQKEPEPSISVKRIPQPVKIETIDDRQLLALFADRSVALVGASGDQQFLFLDGARR